MDSISDLPDDILYIIVSSLSTKSAVVIKRLSKKWENLFDILSDMVFDQSSDDIRIFKFHVGVLLGLHVRHRVRRLSLKFQSPDNSQLKLVNDCLRSVVKRGVMDLELNINVKDVYTLPFEIFTCRTIVQLELGSGFAIEIIPRNALFPTLKTLILDSVRFGDLAGCAFTNLLSACPVIDELVVDGFNWEHWKWSRVVSSQTLKRLTIRRGDWDFHNWSKSDTMSFDTPNVTYFKYTDILLYEYPIVNLNSLVEAKLTLNLRNSETEYSLMNLIKGLRNVQILRLSAVDLMDYLFNHFSEEVPVFENLIHISIKTIAEDLCWHFLRVLLEKSPNLETLTIRGYLHVFYPDEEDWESVCKCLEEYSFLWKCPIKVLEITRFEETYEEMVQIKHILEKLLHLEVLELDLVQARDCERVKIMKELLMLPRASSKCQVLVNYS